MSTRMLSVSINTFTNVSAFKSCELFCTYAHMSFQCYFKSHFCLALESHYLPAGWAVAVALIFEVRHALHHPLVDLRQGEPLLRGALDRLGDEISVWHIPPRVPTRRAALPLGRCRTGAAGRGGERRHLLRVRQLGIRLLRMLLLGMNAVVLAVEVVQMDGFLILVVLGLL